MRKGAQPRLLRGLHRERALGRPSTRWMRRIPAALLLLPLAIAAPESLADDVAARPAERSQLSIVRDVVYGHKDGMALFYDVLEPPRPNGAAVVFLVSGGWFSRWQEPEKRAPGFARLLERGFKVMLVHHGSAPRFKVPDAVEDVRRAVRHIRLQAKTRGIDPGRLGVLGGSAGGHLALMLATSSDEGAAGDADAVLRESDRVQAVVAYYPPVDLRPLVGPNDRFPALDFAPELAAGVSPVQFVSPDDPPTLLIHGDADELVPVENSRRMYAELTKSGVQSRLVVLEGAGHGFRTGDYRERANKAMVEWFERHLNPRDAAAD